MISGHRMRAIGVALCVVCLAASGAALQSQSISASGVSVRDPDQRFLRDMIDHHEGLIYLVHEAMQRPISQKAHEVLDGFDVTEDAEKREMSEVLRSFFRDSHEGTPTEHDRSAADSVLRQSERPGFDQVASAFVVSHHRRGIKLVDAFLPQIRRPRVRELALAIKRKEQREIAFHLRRLATH
jgi:uncharacterized protein (DUF305 family)